MMDSIKLMKKDISILSKLEKSSFLVLIYCFSMGSLIFDSNMAVSLQISSCAAAYGAYGLIVGLMSNEEKKKTSIIFKSIPVRKRSVVMGRYLFSLLIIVLTSVISSIMPLAKTIIEKDFTYVYLSFVNGISFCLLIFSIFFPLFYKFRYEKIQIISFAIFYGLVFVPIGLILLRNVKIIGGIANYMLIFTEIVNSNVIITFVGSILLYVLSMLLSIQIENNK